MASVVVLLSPPPVSAQLHYLLNLDWRTFSLFQHKAIALANLLAAKPEPEKRLVFILQFGICVQGSQWWSFNVIFWATA